MSPQAWSVDVPPGRSSTRTGSRQTSAIRACACSTFAGATRVRLAAREARRVRREPHPGSAVRRLGARLRRDRLRVPVQVASADVFAARAGELGIGDGDLVVTYDDYYGIFAARVAWAFRLYGAEARVLDGGWSTWREERRPVSDGSSGAGRRPLQRATAPAPAPHTRRGPGGARSGAALVDARPRHLFIGEPGVANTGRIPGSRACPTRSSSTARPGCGPRRRPSPGSPATPGSTPIARPPS